MDIFKENFKVYIRIRPFLEREIQRGSTFPITDVTESDKNLKIYEFMVPNLKNSKEIQKMLKNPKYYNIHNFKYDLIFDDKHNQKKIFNSTTESLITKFLNGYNASILAYGQTGTGKTYTMEGEKDNEGLIYQTIKDVLTHMEGRSKKSFKLTASYIQVYNENLSDLLKKKNSKVLLRDLKIKKGDGGIYVENLRKVEIDSVEKAYEIINIGSKNRVSAITKMNIFSSRSHAVFMLNLEQYEKGVKIISKLNLVDLAGSERIKLSGVKGLRLSECKNINKSLSELSNVILKLSTKNQKFINYRNSKLTRLLEDCLGGNSFTSFIGTISPDHDSLPETLTTLKFASRARNIKSTVSINKIEKGKGHLKMLEKYKKDFKKSKNFLDFTEIDNFTDISDFDFSNNYKDINISIKNEDLTNYSFEPNSADEKLELYKSMLVNQRDVLIQLSNKLFIKNKEIIKLKKKIQNDDKGDLFVMKEKIDSIVNNLSQENKSIDLQNIAEELLELQEICGKALEV